MSADPREHRIIDIPDGVRAIRTFLGWTYQDEVWCRLAARITDGPFGHMLGGFDLTDGSRVYYEALMGLDFLGPQPFEQLERFSHREPKNTLVVEYTDLTPGQSEAKRQLCDDSVYAWRYSRWQLLGMAAFERWGLRVPRSRRLVVCSEAWARILGPDLDLRDRRRTRYDEVSPNSAWRRWLEIKMGYSFLNAKRHDE